MIKAQETVRRTMSYSDLFAEMTSTKEVYRLVNATIEYNAATDQRFLESDSIQLASFDTIRINCKVYLDGVVFINTPENINIETGNYLPEISFQKILFADSVALLNSKIEIKSISHSTFLSLIRFSDCNFPNGFAINNCVSKAELFISGAQLQGDLRIQHSKLYGNTNFLMLRMPSSILHVDHCLLDQFLMRWTDAARVIFWENTTKSIIEISYCKIKEQEIYFNHFTNQAIDSTRLYSSLFWINSNDFKKFLWHSNTYEVNNRYATCLGFTKNTISDMFSLTNTDFPNPITMRRNNISGSFGFGQTCNFAQGAYIYETYFNERSTIDWHNLKGKIILSDYSALRKFPESMDSIQSYGLLERELRNAEYYEALIKSKRMFYNVFRTQGLSKSANEVLVEIKDLETAIWKQEYQDNKTIKAYFNWKINVFLKKFSAYGTDPVIAIIYSLKVILLFSLFYLFFHNDWDIGGRKKIGKHLRFILTYFKVNKGLSELDNEHQLKSQNEVALLNSENEESRGKIPAFFTSTIRWYVQSNLISNKLRKLALKKMDILSGTFSKLPQRQQRKVAFLSGAWFVGFLIYTLFLKALNALTLSLNAFTTLGFGNIPTKGFSRYIVIVQGFIGWVLMTIFSVTLITQLLQ